MMRIVHCATKHSESWDSYLENHARASFYHLFRWKAINEKSFRHKTFYLAALNGDEMVGAFPILYMKSRLFGRILCSMPFVNFAGPCTSNSEAENLLLEEAISIAKEHQADYLEIRSFYKTQMELPTSEHKVSLTLELDPDPDIIWKTFTTKHRNDIRRAYKRGLESRVGNGDLLDVFYDVLSESWRDLGTPLYQKEYFKNILEEFPNSTKIFAVYQKDTPVAAALNGYYKNTVEGMWAGLRGKFRKLQPTYVLYWDMIKHACENGYTNYHLGRSSTDSGGEFFKKKWKAEPRQLYWQYYLNRAHKMPQLNVRNPKYQLAINTWKKLPKSVAELVGPPIARCIP